MAGSESQQKGVADLEEPFLPTSSEDVANPEQDRGKLFNGSVNLIKCILGAGLMAIPKAVALLGLVLGCLTMTLVAALTYFTINGIIKATAKRQVDNYPDLVQVSCGSWGSKLLDLSLVLYSFGFEVMYLDIICDVVVGTPESPGMLQDLAALLPPPLNTLILVRPLVLGAIMLFVVLPLALRRDIGSLAGINNVGMLALAAFAASTTWLAGAAVLSGQGHMPRLGPDLEALGSTNMKRLVGVAAIVPVLITSDACQQNMHPLMAMLRPYTNGLLNNIVAVSLAFTTSYYLFIALTSYVAFGPAIQEDILKNLNTSAMAGLLGGWQAQLVAYVVRMSFVVSLMGSTALAMYPFRDALADLLLPPSRKEAGKDRFHVHMTLSTLAIVYVLAAAVPSIWVVISFVGSVAGTGVCFFFPGLIILYNEASKSLWGRASRALATVVVGMGLMLLGNGLYNTFGPSRAEGGDGGDAGGASGVEGMARGMDAGAEAVQGVLRTLWAPFGAAHSAA